MAAVRVVLGLSLVAVAAGIHKFPVTHNSSRPYWETQILRRGRDVCACLNWKELYQNKNVSCGDGAEFYFATKTDSPAGARLGELKSTYGDEFCTKFFEVIDDDYCVNKNIGADEESWCYVSDSCTERIIGLGPNNIFPVRNGLARKKCFALTDKILRDEQPMGVANLAKAKGFDLGLLYKMTYPVSDHLWKHVSPMWRHVGLSKIPDTFRGRMAPRWEEYTEGGMSDELRLELQLSIDASDPIVYYTAADGKPPYIVAEGKRLFLVADNTLSELCPE